MKKTTVKTMSLNEITFLKLEFYLILIAMVSLEILGVSMIHKVMAGAGLILLPIYFFVLTGYLFFGAQIGLSLAFLLPLSSFIITGMPSGLMLYAVGLKSFALCALLYLLPRFLNSRLLILTGSLIGYQAAGFLIFLVMGYAQSAIFTDVINGYPGLILQFVVGAAAIFIMNKRK